MIFQVNFVAAKVACPECINNGTWKRDFLESGSHCRVCGPHRSITFSQRSFEKTTVDEPVCDPDPLKSFVEWILFELPTAYDTVAFAHFGGRFDLIFVFRELYKLGFNPKMIKRGGSFLSI